MAEEYLRQDLVIRYSDDFFPGGFPSVADGWRHLLASALARCASALECAAVAVAESCLDDRAGRYLTRRCSYAAGKEVTGCPGGENIRVVRSPAKEELAAQSCLRYDRVGEALVDACHPSDFEQGDEE